MRACVFLIWLLSALSATAQTKHPFTFEDMMKLKRVEEPAVSPNGKWVLFAAVDVDLQANTKTPHVWVVPLSSSTADPSTVRKDSQANPSTSLGMTGGEREIISDQDADRPRWAPDGKRFAFLSIKENGSQVWIADFDEETGAVTAKHRLTNIATEADGELWSPDGKNILFKSDVYPECDDTPQQETACNTRTLEERKNSKVKALVFTHLLYRHWNAYKEGKRTHLFVVPVFAPSDKPSPPAVPSTGPRDFGAFVLTFPRDLTPGDYDAPVFSLGGQDDYAVSPDGQEICYASNHDREPAISTNNDLFTVPVTFPADAPASQVIAATKDITAENKAADNTPLYSPDGKYIAYRAQQRPGYESDRWRLMLYDRKSREKTEGFTGDNWVGTIAWSADSSKIFYVGTDDEAQQKGQTTIWSIRVESTRVRVINPDPKHPLNLKLKESERVTRGYDDDLTISRDGHALLVTRMSIERPTEIQKVTLPTRIDPYDFPTGEQLSHLNDQVLAQILMSPLEPFWFTGAHNDKVEGFLVKLPNFDPNKKYPLKFVVHGGPQVPMGDEWSYRWNSELFAANGYVVIFINFHGSPGYRQKFIDAVNADWGGAPYEDLMKGLDYAEQIFHSSIKIGSARWGRVSAGT